MAVVREIQVRDEVKHITEGVTGIVLAKYPAPFDPEHKIMVLDVLVNNEHHNVYYQTFMSKWETTRKVEDIE